MIAADIVRAAVFHIIVPVSVLAACRSALQDGNMIETASFAAMHVGLYLVQRVPARRNKQSTKVTPALATINLSGAAHVKVGRGIDSGLSVADLIHSAAANPQS